MPNGGDKMEFEVAGTRCTGYLFRPVDQSSRLPAIIMAHGFSGTQQGSLARTAHDFADAGFAVFTFDYRGFGESEGTPRQVIDIAAQLEDWMAAVAFLREVEGLDHDRIALWGSSLSGAHIVHVAAQDPRIAAVVAQVPFNGFPSKVEGRSAKETLGLLWIAFRDRARALLERPPLYVPVVGRSGESAVITTDRADSIIAALQGSHWENRVAPRVILDMMFGYRPGKLAHRLKMPLLVCVAERDAHTPPKLARLMAERAQRGEVLSYPCSHFDIYEEPTRSSVVADQIDFLKRALRLPSAPMMQKPRVGARLEDDVAMRSPVNLESKLNQFDQKWAPRTVACFNGHDVMVVKVEGEFQWHTHPDSDDFFLVLKGEIDIRLRTGTVTIGAGEMFVVPKGVEHCPVAKQEAHLLLIEPTGTLNTGDAATAAERQLL